MGVESPTRDWFDHVVNFWWGCSKITPGCDFCDAETHAARFWKGQWGEGAHRQLRAEAAGHEALRHDFEAVGKAARPRILANNLADFCEYRGDLARARLIALETMRVTPHLIWMVLTKRPENALRSLQLAQGHCHDLPSLGAWLQRWIARQEIPQNIWFGVSAENQEALDARLPHLLHFPIRHRFLVCEPLLGSIDLLGPTSITVGQGGDTRNLDHLDWVIAGGERGTKARSMDPDWVRGLREQCLEGKVPFFFRGWGDNKSTGDRSLSGQELDALEVAGPDLVHGV